MGDLDTNPGVESQEILDKTVKWSERLYDMTKEEIDSYINGQGDDCNKILYIEYSYKQIGKDDNWFKNIAAKIGDPLTVRREILLQRLHGSSLSPFDQEDIDYIVQCERKPIDELWLLSNYRFDIYKELDRGKPYLVGVDCSTGTGGDNNAITVIDPVTVEPVAEFESSFIGETKYEELLKELVKYLPRAVLCIEKNSIGDGIIDHLLHSPISHRLYYDRAKDLVEDKAIKNQTVESMLKKQATIKTYYGVYTSTASRDDMMAILARHVCTYKEKFITHNVTRDLSRLVRTKSGKIEAGEGFHDDSIMSYLIALYVFYHGNNLTVFGIYPGMMEESEFNTGLKHVDEADPTLVSQSLINSVKEIEAKEQVANKELEWEDILRKSVTQAQQNTYQMYRNNMVNNTVFENSAESSVEEYDDVGEIPLSFFSEINK